MLNLTIFLLTYLHSLLSKVKSACVATAAHQALVDAGNASDFCYILSFVSNCNADSECYWQDPVCVGQIVGDSTMKTFTIQFQLNGLPEQIVSDASTYSLTNSLPGSCSISSCAIKALGCSGTAPSEITKVGMAVSAQKDSLLGYSVGFCIQCQYSGGTTTVDNIQVSLAPYCQSQFVKITPPTFPGVL